MDELLDPMAMTRYLERQRFLDNAKKLQAAGEPGIKIPPLSEEAEQSMLGRIGGAALGGLGYAGSVLEKTLGGRAIRGLLGGKPRELLSVLPLSDTLGITNEADRVAGRDLLRNMGLADKEDTWGNFAAGLATEIFTDPGSYLTFGTGALTKGGQIAQKAGVLPKGVRARLGGTLDDALKTATPAQRAAAEIAAGGADELTRVGGQSLGGLAGFKLPFSELFGAKATPFLTGQSGLNVLDAAATAGQKIADFDKAARTTPYLRHLYNLTPPGMIGAAAPSIGRGLDYGRRYIGSLFDATKFGALEDAGQKAAQFRHAEILPYQAKYLERAAEYGDELMRLGIKDADELRMAIEGVKPHAVDRVNEIAKAMRGDYLEMLQEAQRTGLNVKQFADPLHEALQYGPRQWSQIVDQGGGFGGSSAAALAARDAGLQAGRGDMLSGFAKGTVGINEMIRDAAVYGDATTRGARARHIMANYLRPAQDIVAERMASGTLTTMNAADELKAVQRLQKSQAKELTKFLDDLPEQYSQAAAGTLLDKAGNPIALTAFGHNPIDEYINYVKRFSDMRARGLAAQDLLAQNFLQGAADLPKGAVPLHKAIRDAGLTDTLTYAPGVNTAQAGASASLLNRINQALESQGKTPLASLADLYIDPKIHAELTRINRPFGGPESVGKAVGVLDYLTNLFKTHVTSYFPSFHLRNLTSGQFMNLMKQGLDPLGDVAGAYRMGAGGVWEGLENIPQIRAALEAAGKPVNADEATKQLARWMFAHSVGGTGPHIGRDIITSTGDVLKSPRTLDEAIQKVAGTTPLTATSVARTLAGAKEGTSWLKPLQVAGAGSAHDVFTPVVAGRMTGDIIENLNRSPLYVSYLREGYSPLEAARRVIGAHYDYSAASLTPFERHVMRRLVPFYSFSRFNIPNVIGDIATSPGGIAGQTARLAHDLRQQGGFVPEYMSGQLAIPIGERTPEGHQRYLKSLGLPVEQAFDLIRGTTGGDPLQAGLMSIINQLNPLIKGPLEYATGKQFLSGRELADLYGITGSPLLDQVIYSSPISRHVSTGREFFDTRKDPASIISNLLTGVKFTDIDVPKQQYIAEREYIKRQLQGSPAIRNLQTLIVRPDEIPNLTPEQLELVQLQKLLDHRAKQIKAEASSGGIIRYSGLT